VVYTDVRSRRDFVLLLLIALVAAPLCAQSVPPAAIKVVGSTTIQPLIEEVAAAYHESSGGAVEVLGGGSGTGLEAVRAGTADVGMVSRSLTPEERAEFFYTTIGYDGLAIIVNRENPREHITTAELREIYAGGMQIWNEAPQWAAEIVVISKQAGRGTLAVFEEYIGVGRPISEGAWEAGSNLDSILWVGGIPGAIGFVSVGAADEFISIGHPIRKLTLDGVPADRKSIESGSYPIIRQLTLVYRNDNESARSLVAYMASESARAAIIAGGYVPSEVR
jgi:phosphate transport system substrate-binding protein